MGKEYRFWQTERRVFAEKLADEERQAGDTKEGENLGADLDNEIKQVCHVASLAPVVPSTMQQSAEALQIHAVCCTVAQGLQFMKWSWRRLAWEGA